MSLTSPRTTTRRGPRSINRTAAGLSGGRNSSAFLGRFREMRAQGWVWALGLASVACVWAQLPLEPPHTSGQSITGAFEGWFPNGDGTFSMLLGYFNRNTREALDIPVGPNNHIDPGGPDHGQPTHFVPGRMWGSFVIKVPKDFGDKKFTWTIVA